MKAFAEAMAEFIQNGIIVEIQVGMGPCGELRYPSYMLSQGWNYPGVGLIMAYDQGMQKMSTKERLKIPGSASSDTNVGPDKSDLFKSPAFPATRGKSSPACFFGSDALFMRWYAKVLQEHGRAVLQATFEAFPKSSCPGISFSVKISGIHWWHLHPSRAAEACAGYVCGGGVNSYADIAKMLSEASTDSERPVMFNFTCLEMTNGDNENFSAPEDLIAQVRQTCVEWNVPLCGENALQFDLATGQWAFSQISKQIRGWSKGRDRLHSFTILRLDDGFVKSRSLKAFKDFCQHI